MSSNSSDNTQHKQLVEVFHRKNLVDRNKETKAIENSTILYRYQKEADENERIARQKIFEALKPKQEKEADKMSAAVNPGSTIETKYKRRMMKAIQQTLPELKAAQAQSKMDKKDV